MQAYSSLTSNFCVSNFPIEDTNEETLAFTHRYRSTLFGRPPAARTGWRRWVREFSREPNGDSRRGRLCRSILRLCARPHQGPPQLVKVTSQPLPMGWLLKTLSEPPESKTYANSSGRC